MNKNTREQIIEFIATNPKHKALREIAKHSFIKVYRVHVANILNNTEKLPDIKVECSKFRQLWTV